MRLIKVYRLTDLSRPVGEICEFSDGAVAFRTFGKSLPLGMMVYKSYDELARIWLSKDYMCRELLKEVPRPKPEPDAPPESPPPPPPEEEAPVKKSIGPEWLDGA